MRNIIFILLVMIGSALFAQERTVAKFTDSYNILLNKYIKSSKNKDGTITTSVDYAGLRKSRNCAITSAYLTKVFSIDKLTEQDQLAFWINAYNFLAINKVVNNPKIKKLTDLNTLFTSVWKQPAGKIDSKEYTLDEIEHTIIRKRFKEPRIHFAVVCVAKSCPNIRNEVYTGEKLDEQLNDQMRQFLSNKAKGMKIDKKNNKIYLSKIFTWFAIDFNKRPLEWLFEKKMIDKTVKDRYSLKFLNYDWSLNEK